MVYNLESLYNNLSSAVEKHEEESDVIARENLKRVRERAVSRQNRLNDIVSAYGRKFNDSDEANLKEEIEEAKAKAVEEVRQRNVEVKGSQDYNDEEIRNGFKQLWSNMKKTMEHQQTLDNKRMR